MDSALHPLLQVPPELDADEVDRLHAAPLVAHAREVGATHALVGGEFGLTVALLRGLQQVGVVCVQATTHREADEVTQEDGSTHRQSVFRFLGWRVYPALTPG